jgi:GTP-binding protein
MLFLKHCKKVELYLKPTANRKRVLKLIEKAKYIHEEYNKHISTGLLNEVLREAMILNPPTTRKGRALKLKYMTQANTTPPKFILFVNDSEIMHFSYLRYLENKLRDAFGFEGCPLEFILKGKND